MIRKMTKAYQLKPMPNPIKALQYKGKWIPVTDDELKEKQMFLYGQGWQKIGIKMLNTVTEIPNLSKNWTAQNIKEVAEKFSLDVAKGLLEGWGSQSVYHDQSLGLIYAKHEIINMALFGKVYDDFTDKVHDLSQRFIKHLLLYKGYHFIGAWLYYKDKLIDQAGLYDPIWLSPLQHIQHLLKGMVHLYPSFDPIGWDEVLIKLIMARPNGQTLDKHISVKDRIKFLTTQKLAYDFEQIFTWQQVFYSKGEK